jgi:hypothetical protein
MIWIPVVFLCLAQQCGFMQGETVYTEAGCEEQLLSLSRVLSMDPRVTAFDGACFSVSPT